MSRTNPFVVRMAQHVGPAQLQRGRENHEVLREQHEYDRQQATWRAQEMANRDKSPMGFHRTDTSQAQKALAEWGDLNAALDEAVDEIEKAFARERQKTSIGGPDNNDLRRAPVLGNRRRVS